MSKARKVYYKIQSVKFRLVFSSLLPIFLILCLRFFPSSLGVNMANFVFSSSLLLSIVGFLMFYSLLPRTAEGGGSAQTITDSKDDGGLAAAYLSTYILPLLVTSYADWKSIGAFSLYMFIALIIFYRSELPVVNPLFYLLGYKVYSVSTNSGFNGSIIAPHGMKIKKQEMYSFQEFSSDLAYIRKK